MKLYVMLAVLAIGGVMTAADSQNTVEIEIKAAREDAMAGLYPGRKELFACPIDLKMLPESMWKLPGRLNFEVRPAMPDQLKAGGSISACYKADAPGSGTLYWSAVADDVPVSYWTVSISKINDLPDRLVYPPLSGFGDRLYMHQAGTIHRPYSQKLNLVDLNGDGRLDLVIGNFSDGVLLMENVGGNKPSEALFDNSKIYKLKDDSGKYIINHGIGVSFSSPAAGDLNGDGLIDLVVGSKWKKEMKIYLNSGNLQEPVFTPSGIIEQNGFPEIGDWNGDGKNDIIFSPLDKYFKIMVCLNQGGNNWAPPKQVFADESLNCGSNPHFSPVITYADLDKDGLKDIIVTTPDGSYFYKNTGSRKSPAFASKLNMNIWGIPGMNSCGLAVVDWDLDGKNDLVSAYGNVFINKSTNDNTKFETYTDAFKSISPEFMDIPYLNHFLCDSKNGSGPCDIAEVRNSKLRILEYTSSGYIPGKIVNLPMAQTGLAGCPDPGEHDSLYSHAAYADLDGDGIKDLIINDEDSWRYGFIRYLRGRGNWQFDNEEQLILCNLNDWIHFAPGYKNEALQLTNETYKDYLSYPVKGNINPDGGQIELYYSPQKNPASGDSVLFFSGINSPQQQSPPPFLIEILSSGMIEFSSSSFKITTQQPIDFKPGEWYFIKCKWSMDKIEIEASHADSSKKITATCEGKYSAPVLGERFYLGNRFQPGIQKEREITNRKAAAYADCATGLLDEFKSYDLTGNLLLHLSFDKTAGDDHHRFADRMPVGYRCTPEVADINHDGLPDLILMIADGKRGFEGDYDFSADFDSKALGRGCLMVFKNTGTKGKPVFASGEKLYLSDGNPIRCHYRTQIIYRDWDKDGKDDLILVSEKIAGRINQLNESIEFFRNTGTTRNGLPVFERHGQLFKNLKNNFSHHHEPVVQILDWDGDGWLDMIVNSDHCGIQIFSNSMINPKYRTAQIIKYNFKQ
ncbi:MAG: VCBS repeat-containing protein [Victivallaceae bacterium]|jgi:hypothetical protein